MFNFTKKNLTLEEHILEDISDEQLSQVTGGALLDTLNVGSVLGVVDVAGVLGTVDSTATQLLGSTNVGGLQVQVAGVSVSTPSISPRSLL